MKKAVLLLGMVMMIAGCICFKNMDKDTVLSEQSLSGEAVYSEGRPVEVTEEISYTSEEESDVQETDAASEENHPVSVTEESAAVGSFVFRHLNPEEQKIYVEILDSLLDNEEETILSTVDTALIDKIFNCVMLDHPEIFYVDGYQYTEYKSGDIVKKITFTGDYRYDQEEQKRRNQAIEESAEDILSRIPKTEDEYAKVKYIYDTLIENVEYDLQATDNQNICSVFLNQKSVCQGYAKALQYLLQKSGMECSLVIGTVSEGESHAWNLVKVNKEWYYLDVTWGDAFYLFNESDEQMVTQQYVMTNYDYFCVTTEQLLKTHSINMPIEMPLCEAVTDNYFIRENLYFTAYDEERIRQIFADAVENAQESVTLKCGSLQTYEELYRILITEQHIFEYITVEDTVAYTDNQLQYSLTFWI